MSAASRAATEAAAKLAALRKPNKMGTCPICTLPIYVNQDTAWASLDGNPTRVHKSCRTCGDCGQPITPHHYRDTGSATTLAPGYCPVLFERRNRHDH